MQLGPHCYQKQTVRFPLTLGAQKFLTDISAIIFANIYYVYP